jgi:hypothetical protein
VVGVTAVEVLLALRALVVLAVAVILVALGRQELLGKVMLAVPGLRPLITVLVAAVAQGL